MHESPVHDKARIDQGRIDVELGHGKNSGDFQVEMHEPVPGKRPGLLMGVAVYFTVWTKDAINNLGGHVVAEGEGNRVFSASAREFVCDTHDIIIRSFTFPHPALW